MPLACFIEAVSSGGIQIKKARPVLVLTHFFHFYHILLSCPPRPKPSLIGRLLLSQGHPNKKSKTVWSCFFYLVPRGRLELPRPKAVDFESTVSTIPPPGHLKYGDYSRSQAVSSQLKSRMLSFCM
jgi:hypothetical protein